MILSFPDSQTQSEAGMQERRCATQRQDKDKRYTESGGQVT
jgi:hypothetical protein